MCNMKYKKLFQVFCCFLFACLAHVDGVAYKDAAVPVRDGLLDLQNNFLHAHYMKETLNRKPFTSKRIDGAVKIKELSSTLKAFFQKVFQAVGSIQNKVVTIYKNGGFQPDSTTECCKIDDRDLEYDPEFKTKVIKKFCYRRSDSSTNAYIPASDGLLEVFRKNRDTFPSLKWQYYGTEVGTITIYPGHLADNCTNYDPRFRPWYAESATPTSKDLVIVFDRSDSMKNDDKLALSKAAAQTVINTLNPNDRLALVLFSTDAITPYGTSDETCYQSEMAYATPEVKAYFQEYLEKDLEASGNTVYKKALQKAFDILKMVAPETDRQKAIMFMTDGAPSDDAGGVKKLLAELNAQQGNRVLILTYGIGQGGDLEDARPLLQDMANMTEYNASAGDKVVGHFEIIKETGQLRTKLGSYYNHFIRSTDSSTPIVTVPYTDFFKLGHIFSVCLPVKDNNELKGATCIDVPLNDVKQSFGLLQDDTIYAFIIDKTGRTLIHPLLPSPGEDAESDPLFVNIKVLEPEAEANGIIDEMIRLQSGNKTIQKTVVKSRGNAKYDGIDKIDLEADYFWEKIPNTKFSVCLVITRENDPLEMNEDNKYVEDFHYHLLKYDNGRQMCEHDNQSVTKEYATIQFSNKALTDPSLKDSREYVGQITTYFEGNTHQENFDFKSDIRRSVALIESLGDRWKDSFQPYIYQMYLGTYHGIFMVYPGKQLSAAYDHTTSNWFKKAQKDRFSTVLLQKGGHVTMATALRVRNHNDRLWGVMGMDFDPSVLQSIINTNVEECYENSNYSCMLMDESGYILYHSDYNSKDSTLLPIAKVEPDIAHYLTKSKNILFPNECTDYAWKKQYHTHQAKEDANPDDMLTSYPYFFFTPIAETNVYFIVKNTVKSTPFRTCNSCPSSFTDLNECYKLEGKCYCPCFTKAEYDHCTNSFEGEGQVYPPCVKTEQEVDMTSVSEDITSAQCFPFSCTQLVSSEECSLHPGCGWCYTNTSFDNKQCHLRHYCVNAPPDQTTPVEPTSAPTSGKGKNVVSIVVPIIVILVVAVIIAAAVVYMYRHNINPCAQCTAKPKVQADGLYTDIPHDGNSLNSNATMIRNQPEGPYSVSPMGFMNFSYGASQHSVIPSNSDASYATPPNPQPVLILPVNNMNQVPMTHRTSAQMLSQEYLQPNQSDSLPSSGQSTVPLNRTGSAEPVQSQLSHSPSVITQDGNAIIHDGQIYYRSNEVVALNQQKPVFALGPVPPGRSPSGSQQDTNPAPLSTSPGTYSSSLGSDHQQSASINSTGCEPATPAFHNHSVNDTNQRVGEGSASRNRLSSGYLTTGPALVIQNQTLTQDYV